MAKKTRHLRRVPVVMYEAIVPHGRRKLDAPYESAAGIPCTAFS